MYIYCHPRACCMYLHQSPIMIIRLINCWELMGNLAFGLGFCSCECHFEALIWFEFALLLWTELASGHTRFWVVFVFWSHVDWYLVDKTTWQLFSCSNHMWIDIQLAKPHLWVPTRSTIEVELIIELGLVRGPEMANHCPCSSLLNCREAQPAYI